jgi:hypothetical protein
MAGGVTTGAVLIIAPVANVQAVRNYLRSVDPTQTADSLQVPVRQLGDSTDTVAAYWASWNMDETDKNELRKGLRTIGQAALLTPDDPLPAWNPARAAYVFDGTFYPNPYLSPLRTLGLEPMSDDYEIVG